MSDLDTRVYQSVIANYMKAEVNSYEETHYLNAFEFLFGLYFADLVIHFKEKDGE